MLKGLNHITLSVRELSRSVAYYTELLEFCLHARWSRGAYLTLGDLWLCLSLDAHARKGPFPEYTHIALTVDERDFHAFSRKVEQGAHPTWKENTSEGESIYLLDPDGHKLEVHAGSLESRLAALQKEPYDGLETTDSAILYCDPTSEPCRAVHWFALEAGIPIRLRYTWLGRGEHRGQELLEVNPCHQVPALRHGEFCLAEASAIMLYLADHHSCLEKWLGETSQERAQVHRYLSWYHTNLRQKVTLGYLLPVHFLPYYRGSPRPPDEQIQMLRAGFRETLEHLDRFLTAKAYLSGNRLTLADFLFAPELYALDIDPERDRILSPFPWISAWLERLREMPSYMESHRQWNRVVPLFREKNSKRPSERPDLSWIDDLMNPAR